MSHKNLLSRYRRHSYSRSSSDCTRGYSSSPSVEPPIWASRPRVTSSTSASSSAFSARPPPVRLATQPADLFSTLLFDRELAYRGGVPTPTSSRSVLPGSSPQQHDTRNINGSHYNILTLPAATPAQEPAQPATNAYWSSSDLETDEESASGGDDMIATLGFKEKARDKTTVSKKKAKPPTKRPAESPAKKKKAVAKSGGKAVAQAVSITRKRTASKSESSPERSTKAPKTKTGSRANIGRKINSKDSDKTPDKATASEIIEISDSEEDTTNETRDMLRHTRAAPTWGWPASSPIKQDDSEVPTTARPRSPSNPIIDEVQKIRKELETAQDKNKLLHADLEKCKASAKLEQENMKTKYEGSISKLTKDLDSEKQRVEDVTLQREELRAQLQLHQEDAAEYTKLRTEHDALKAQYDEEKTSHEEVLQDVFKNNEATKAEVTTLQAKNARLTSEVQTFKATASNALPKFVPPPSPAPSSAFSFSSDEERREENVRKMYIKTKRQFDNLTAATKGVIDCTKGMDLSSFGEFGRCVKRMKTAVEPEDGVPGRNVGGSGIGKTDDEDGWGSSQRSRGSRL